MSSWWGNSANGKGQVYRYLLLAGDKVEGSSARVLGGYKFLWKGCAEGVAEVGVLVAEKWVNSVMEVKRVSESMMVWMMVWIRVGKRILNLVSVYVP